MIRVEGDTAYVDTISESFDAVDTPGVKYVVYNDNEVRLQAQRLLKGFSIK